jgi:hypothetical protein
LQEPIFSYWLLILSLILSISPFFGSCTVSWRPPW